MGAKLTGIVIKPYIVGIIRGDKSARGSISAPAAFIAGSA